MECLQEVKLKSEEAEKNIFRKDLAQVHYSEYCDLKRQHDELNEKTNELSEMDSIKKNLLLAENIVKEQKKVIQVQKNQLYVLKEEIKAHLASIENKEKVNTLLELELKNEVKKGLRDHVKDFKIKAKMADEALKKSLKGNSNMNNKMASHTSMVNGYKMEQRRDKERIRTMETYQQQLKKDLHECCQLMSDTDSFKRSIRACCRKYLDDDATVVVHEEDVATAAGIRKAALDYRDSVRTEQLNRRDENKKMLKKQQQEDKIVSQYIDTINTQRREIKTLREEIKKVSKPVEKPVIQKVKSWIRKKVRESDRVGPMISGARVYDDCLRITPLRSALSEEENILKEEEEDRLPEPSDLSPASTSRTIQIHVNPYVPKDVVPMNE